MSALISFEYFARLRSSRILEVATSSPMKGLDFEIACEGAPKPRNADCAADSVKALNMKCRRFILRTDPLA